MSARQLEDFIKVIETAEKLEKRPASSIWSYPTDVFTRSSSPRRITPRPSAPPNVPKLWDPKSGSDFLGSSWASSCRSGNNGDSTPCSAVPTQSSSSKSSHPTTVRSATSASARSSVRNANSNQQQSGGGVKVVNAEGLSDLNVLMTMQMGNRFARKQYKELLSSISPGHSPRPPRKSSSKSPNNASGSKAKTSSSSRSPSSRKPKASISSSPKKTSGSDSTETGNSKIKTSKSQITDSSSPASTKSKPLKSPSSSSKGEDVGSVISPKKASTSSSSVFEDDMGQPKSPSPPPLSRKTLARSVKINVDDEAEEIEEGLRPLPKPRAKPRTSEQNGSKKNRPKSAPTPKKKTPATAQVQQQELVDLRSYSKSLKLLGLDIPSNRTEATKVTTQTIDVKNKEPTMRTRLKERTQSVSDLKEIVDSKHHLPKEEYGKIKANLTNAVFEEWYFSKMKEYSDKKYNEMEKIEAKIYQKEVEEVEKKEKAAEEFKRWLEGKRQQLRKTARQLKKKNNANNEDTEARLAKIKQAEEEWKQLKAADQKNKEKLKRRLQKKQEQDKEKQMQKREEAQKHFINWEQTWKQKMKVKMSEEKQRSLEELEVKKAAAKENREAAEAAFNCWKTKKKEENLKKKPAKAAAAAIEKEAVAEVETEKKLEAARDAYENWLEYIEQREEEDKCAEEERELREMWRPPWYPPGIADY